MTLQWQTYNHVFGKNQQNFVTKSNKPLHVQIIFKSFSRFEESQNGMKNENLYYEYKKQINNVGEKPK